MSEKKLKLITTEKKSKKKTEKITPKSTQPKILKPRKIISKEDIQPNTERLFILDTNVLIHDPRAFFSFNEKATVGIPFIVLEELDAFKKENDERGRNARETARILDHLRMQGQLSEGVRIRLEDGHTGAVVKVFPTPPTLTFSTSTHSIKDNLIIQTAHNLTGQGLKVTLITKDINVRVKASVLNIDVQDYEKGKVSYDHFYKGWIKIPIGAGDLRKVGQQRISELVAHEELFPNEFIILHSENNEDNYRLFRYFGPHHIIEVKNPTILHSFTAKNVQQQMAIDLLLDDNVQLVTLLGPAGTGKTFLALVAGLFKVAYEHIYRKLLVTRPVVALGSDIGYLPGDLQEKLHYWMQPVHDNLDFIFSQMVRGSEMQLHLDDRKEKRRRQFNDQNHQNGQRNNKQPHNVESLVQKGILSLEAITYMRGRSIPYQFMFIDEVQNLTHHEVKSIVSRAGVGTKVILAGDPYQIDSPYLDFSSNGLTVTAEKMKDQPIAGSVFLDRSERSELAKIAATIL